MRISTVLFDLDGTLLPMDMDTFSKAYFSGLISCLRPFGIEADELYAAFQGGINAMVKNNGGETNETVFWSYFRERFGDKVRDMLPAVNRWYREDFEKIRSSCGGCPLQGGGSQNRSCNKPVLSAHCNRSKNALGRA